MPDLSRLGLQFRTLTIDRVDGDKPEDRAVDVTFSTEEPVERFGWVEILDHGTGSVRLGRLLTGAPVLVNHDPDRQVGVIESAQVDVASRKGRARLRFGRSGQATEIWQDIQDGIRQSISVGYRIHRMTLEKQEDGQLDVYRVDDWEPTEVSVVAIPADLVAGIGRQADGDTTWPVDVRTGSGLQTGREGKKTMDPENTNQGQAPAAEAAPGAGPGPAPVVQAPAGAGDRERQERDRVDRILAIAAKYGQSDLARQFIRDGRSAEEFGNAVLDRIGDNRMPVPDGRVGLNQREVGRYSLVRVIRAFANPSDRKAQQDAAFELEVSQAALKAMGRDLRAGAQFTVPGDVLMAAGGRRDLTIGTTTATGGGAMVAYDVQGQNFIDVLRSRLSLAQLGATVLTDLNGKVSIPRKSTSITAYWVAENGATTEGNAVLDQITLSGYTVAGYQDIGRRLMNQASLDVESMVRADLAGSVAIAIEAAVINGTSTANQPNGILKTTGIGASTGGANGANVTWSNLVELEYEVGVDNADFGRIAYLTNPKQRQRMKSIVKATAGAIGFLWDQNTPDVPVNGYACGVTTNVPANLTKGTSTAVCSAIIFGNFADLVIGFWAGLDILVDPYTGSSAGTVRVVAMQDVDAALRHPESFAAMQDAL